MYIVYVGDLKFLPFKTWREEQKIDFALVIVGIFSGVLVAVIVYFIYTHFAHWNEIERLNAKIRKSRYYNYATGARTPIDKECKQNDEEYLSFLLPYREFFSHMHHYYRHY